MACSCQKREWVPVPGSRMVSSSQVSISSLRHYSHVVPGIPRSAVRTGKAGSPFQFNDVTNRDPCSVSQMSCIGNHSSGLAIR